MNAVDLTRKWIRITGDKETEFAKLCGIFQGLLKKFNSNEISDTINIFHFYYPKSGILKFAVYCKRIILNERTKKNNK